MTSHYLEPFNLLHPMFCTCYFSSDVSLSLSATEDLLLEKIVRIVRGYKRGRGKRQSKWLWNLWKWRMTPVPNNFLHQMGSLTHENIRKLTLYRALLNTYKKRSLKKKAQPNFLQTTTKPGIILIIFIMVWLFLFCFYTSSVSVEFYELTTLDEMILWAVKLSRLAVSSTQLKWGFNFPFQFIYGQPVTRSGFWEYCIKSGGKKLTAEKGNLLADHCGNAVSYFLKSIFIVKHIFRYKINVPLPKVIFSQVFEKMNSSTFKNVM